MVVHREGKSPTSPTFQLWLKAILHHETAAKQTGFKLTVPTRLRNTELITNSDYFSGNQQQIKLFLSSFCLGSYRLFHSPLRRECPPDPFVSVRHPERQNSATAQLWVRPLFVGEKTKLITQNRVGATVKSHRQAFGFPVSPKLFTLFREKPLSRFLSGGFAVNKVASSAQPAATVGLQSSCARREVPPPAWEL